MNPTRNYIGALLIAVAGIMFWVLAMPAYDQINNLRAALDERSSILDSHTTILNNLNTLNKQYSENAANIQRFSNIVPTTKNSAELVSTMQALASQNGLTLTSIALSAAQNQDTNPYNTQPIDIGLSGSYPSFRSFLNALETNLRILDIQTIDVNPISGNVNTLSFRIKANTYYLKK